MENTVQARAVRVAGECEAFPRSYFSVVCCDEGDIAAEAIEVICEHELTIVANGCELATLMCSNANLSELVYGFLFSEGVIGDVREDGLAALIEELWFDGPKAEPSDRSFGSAWETMER